MQFSKRSWRPDPEGELLLLAAIGGRTAALEAWRTWSAHGQVSDLSLGAVRLLPLIHENLQVHGIGDGISHAAGDALAAMWCETHLLFHEAGDLLRALERAGISTMVLKGAALAFLDYPDPTLRPMSDIDVLVPARETARAMSVLRAAGWTSLYASPEAFFPFHHGTAFKNPRGGSVDLHWRVLWQGKFLGDDDRQFWDRSVALTLEGATARALAAEDRLLHVCVHGMEWHPMLPIRWVADAAMIIRRHGSVVDWDRLVQQACERRLALPLADALGYLREKCELPVPSRTLDILRRTPASRLTRISYRIRSGREGSYLSCVNDWAIGWRVHGPAPFHRKIAHFMTYFAVAKELPHPWQTPFWLAFSSARLLARVCRAAVAGVLSVRRVSDADLRRAR